MFSPLLLVPAVLLCALAGELLLGFLVLHRAGQALPARFLGASLILHPLAIGLVPVSILLAELGPDLAGPPIAVVYLDLLVLGFLPALDLAFALTYPTLHPVLRGRKFLAFLTFLPTLALLAFQTTFLMRHYARDQPFLDMMETYGFVSVMFFVTYVTLAALTAAVIFYRRASRARTDLERRRVRFMYRVVSIPTFCTVVAFVGFIFLANIFSSLVDHLPWALVGTILITLFSIFVLIPSIGVGYGVLRYQILDIKGGLRVTVSRSIVGTAFVAMFFIVSNGAQVIITDRLQSALLGVLGSGLLVFAIHPIERLADRVASQTVPQSQDRAKYLEFRRWEIYRATFEDLVADDKITTRERRSLTALAKNLGLNTKAVRTIEDAVESEIAATPRGGS